MGLTFNQCVVDNCKKYQSPILSGIICGFLTHMFMFTNKLVNHDEIHHMFEKGATLSSGRWGLDLLSYIFPDYSMPWIYGVISILLITISACFVVSIFKIENKCLQALIAGLFVTFPSLTSTFSYMFTASSYALAFCFSIISVKLFIDKRTPLKVLSFFLLALTFGIYQAYISVTATLLLLLLIQQLLKDEENHLKFIKRCIWYLSFLAISFALYYLITFLLLNFFQVGFNAYAGDALSSSTTLFQKIDLAYDMFFGTIKNGLYGLIPYKFARILHWICIALVLIKLFFLGWKKSVITKLFLIITCALIPLSINCMFLISNAGSIHSLVLYGFCTLYIFWFIVADIHLDASNIIILANQSFKKLLATAAFLILIANVYVGNQVYLCLHLRYENAYAFYSSIITSVKNTPGFDENTKLAIIGDAQTLIYQQPEFEQISLMAGSYGFSVSEFSKFEFIQRYIGLDIQEASAEEVERIQATQDFIEMPQYPYYGSIKKINDCVVVKFGD